MGASTEYRVNSPVGEYGILYATGTVGLGAPFLLNPTADAHTTTVNGDKYWYAGLLFYQAGVMVLTASLFKSGSVGGHGQLGPSIGQDNDTYVQMGYSPYYAGAQLQSIDQILTGSTISASADYFRHRIYNLQFNNTTELNSTIYFCRANHNEFNYSSNPTYTSKSKIRVKSQASDEPVSYITTVGLYNDNNELLATAKLSEPLKKSPGNEFTLPGPFGLLKCYVVL